MEVLMTYWQLYYHLVTATKNRQPLLTPAVEPLLYSFIKNKAYELEATIWAINGVKDHMHMVVSIHPKVAVSTFMGQVKGYAATQFNHLPDRPGDPVFWQSDYAAFSLDRKGLPRVIAYVERQKEHHRQKTLIAALERCEEGPRKVGEESGLYEVDWPD
jgi:putative transposase